MNFLSPTNLFSRRNYKIRLGALLLALMALMTGCHTVPETGRSAFTMLPESQVIGMSQSSFEQVKATAPLITSGERYDMIQRVARRIQDAASSDMPNAQWEVIYIDEPQANAWAMPGGKIAIYDGLFDVIDTEDELAFIMGHEVAHVTARHSNQRLSQAMLLAGLGIGVSYSIRDLDSSSQQLILALYGVGSAVGLALPYSRMHEREADFIGQIYMARAGYDPSVAPGVWEKMSAAHSGGPPAWLSTHPSHEDRARLLRENLPRAKQEYQRAGHSHHHHNH